MKLKNRIPNEPNINILREYYFIEINTDTNQKTIPVIDDCCYDFIFFKEAKATLTHGETNTKAPINSKIFTVHNLKPPYKISIENSLTFFTIKLQPWLNGYFFSHLKQDGIISLETTNTLLNDFYKKVYQLNNYEEMFLLADNCKIFSDIKLTKSMVFVKSICKLIEEKKGIITVNEISLQFNTSRQYLNRIFKKEVIYSLKYYITSVRILNLIKHKTHNNQISLTKVCYDFGYYDQSHFIRDFKKICGVTPTTFFNNLPEFLLRH